MSVADIWLMVSSLPNAVVLHLTILESGTTSSEFGSFQPACQHVPCKRLRVQ